MNTIIAEGVELATTILKADIELLPNQETILFPPFTHLSELKRIFDSKKPVQTYFGGQDCSQHSLGAYTGEVSGAMLHSTGATHAIIGHSERRAYHNESNTILLAKLHAVLNHNLTPVFCIGEQLENREAGNHFDVVIQQLKETVLKLKEEAFSKIVLAYEPVWAIGTGKTATPYQAQEMHAKIRNTISQAYNQTIAENITILYGGSCKPQNANDIFVQPDIDGGLIGGASLKADSFIELINILKNKKQK